jgi:hypothetical protein
MWVLYGTPKGTWPHGKQHLRSMKTIHRLTPCLALSLAAAMGGFFLGRVSNKSATSRSTQRGSTEHTQTVQSRRGMTWGKVLHNEHLGTDFVSCHAPPAPEGGDCDPHRGDTPCTKIRPILCLKVESAPRPPYPVTGTGYAMPREYYQGWAGGRIGLSEAVAGTELHSLAEADERCESALGTGYRMAEHHDGKYVQGMDVDQFFGASWPSPRALLSGGWAFHAYGNVPKNTRFWVHINDQSANCWDNRPVLERRTAQRPDRTRSRVFETP